MDLVRQYFPALSADQYAAFDQLEPLYREWNARINVISRQDVDNLGERHILHSLAIARAFTFRPGSQVVDLGTGGGFPGIPLAIYFPEVQFTLIDGIGKKITVVREVAAALELKNVTAQQARAEEIRAAGNFDFVVSRAVAPLDKLLGWSRRLLRRQHTHSYPNGLIALKGGDLGPEIAALPGQGSAYTEVFPIRSWFDRPFFDEKYVVYVQG